MPGGKIINRLLALLCALIFMFVVSMPLASAEEISKPDPIGVVEKMMLAMERLVRLNNAEVEDLVNLANRYLVDGFGELVSQEEAAALKSNGIDQEILGEAVGVIDDLTLTPSQITAIRDELIKDTGISNTVEVVSDLLGVFMRVPAGGNTSFIGSLITKYDVTMNDIANSISKLMDIHRPTLEITDDLIADVIDALEAADLVKTADNSDGKIPIEDLRKNGLNRANAEKLRQRILENDNDAAMARRILLRIGYYTPQYPLGVQAGEVSLPGLFEIEYGNGAFQDRSTVTVESSEAKGTSRLRFLTSGLKLTFNKEPVNAISLKLAVREPFNYSGVQTSNVGVYKKSESGDEWVRISGSSFANSGDGVWVATASISGTGEYAVAERIVSEGGAPSAPPALPESVVVSDKDLKIGEEPEVVYSVPEGTKSVTLNSSAIVALTANEKSLAIETEFGTFKVPREVLQTLSSNVGLTLSFERLEQDEMDPLTKDLAEEYNPLYALDINLRVRSDGEESQLSLTHPVKITFSYAGADLEDIDEDKLGVYYYDEETREWEYVGGKINKEDKTIEVEVYHFSKYAIMVYDKTFQDIVGHWAKRDIEIMASRHVVKGVTDGLYEPDRSITRAEFTALLARALKLPYDDSMTIPFVDVSSSDWFRKEVTAAYAAGLVKGTSPTVFDPAADITREQMGALVVRALMHVGKGVTLSEDEVTQVLAGFEDAGGVSAWARAEVAAAIKSGIIKGRTANTIVPAAGATRAESAVMVKRMLDKILYQ